MASILQNLPAVPVLLLVATVRADLGLSFIRSPEPIVAPIGDDVVFECSLNVPSEAVRWRHNGVAIEHEHPTAMRPSATSRLLVKFNDEKQEGDYQCVAWFGASALASTPARLTTAQLQPFLYQPHRQYTVTAGNSVVINCPPPVSKPAAIIQYQHNKNLVPDNSIILPTTGSLLLSNVSEKDSGVYSCFATNYITGLIIDSPLKITLTVEQPKEPSPPRFLYTPQSKYVIQSKQNVTLECSGVGQPPPKATWRRVNGVLPNDRIDLSYGALTLTNVQPSDQGQYVCELSNGVPPMQAHLVSLQVQVPPVVTKGPANAVIEEDSDTELVCEVTGAPSPNITWLLNGESVNNDSHIIPISGKLMIKKIQKRHAGIYQCFASNPVGTTYGSAMIQVSPTQVTQVGAEYSPDNEDPEFEESSEGSSAASVAPGRNHKKDHRKGKGRRKDKKHKAVMIPPTRPNITRLSDKSVMVRWSVPNNAGLPIQFFKVQFQDLDNRPSSWMTSNEDIPPHIRSYEVDNLTTDHHYKFRIAAVYSNNDNKLGRNSAKFHLQKGSPSNRTPLYPPTLTHTEAISPTEIRIHWEYLNSVLAPVDGFYVYYRATTSAGDYIKATVEGENTRNFVITHLAPDTAYDIKLQSFTVGAASDFSAILTHKTLREANATEAPVPDVIGISGISSTEKTSHGQLYLVLGTVIAGLTLLLTLAVAICICYRRSINSDDHDGVESCDKSGGVDPGITIQPLEPVTINGFVHNGKVNGRVGNGFLPRSMNITNNPLADSEQNKNVMELTYMTSQNNNCTSSEGRSDREDDLDLDCGKRRGSWRSTRVPRSGENYV
ncbi:interference hedgehog-like isoform X2 [Cimex lectularius]|uniref:Interference hedgehog n=1 Tax=Cimex lectularius TaxID=79782 RepID=A0A8I6S4Z6_CIMLE|nr:interference hedgehog-like isoform X2 [Cimex lectularius]